ncbi:MAG: nuclear transport factor 2 family protein [Acidimicrobiales bacterium]
MGAWNEADPDRRRVKLAEVVGPDCLFEGPTGSVRGLAALHATIAEAREFLPSAVVVRRGPLRRTGDGELRFAWEVVGPDGGAVLAGVDVIELDQSGRLARVTVLPPSSS